MPRGQTLTAGSKKKKILQEHKSVPAKVEGAQTTTPSAEERSSIDKSRARQGATSACQEPLLGPARGLVSMKLKVLQGMCGGVQAPSLTPRQAPASPSPVDFHI